MPMIDVYAEAGTFSDPAALAARLAATLMEVEQVPDISLFRRNTAAFVHESTVANIDGAFIPKAACRDATSLTEELTTRQSRRGAYRHRLQPLPSATVRSTAR